MEFVSIIRNPYIDSLNVYGSNGELCGYKMVFGFRFKADGCEYCVELNDVNIGTVKFLDIVLDFMEYLNVDCVRDMMSRQVEFDVKDGTATIKSTDKEDKFYYKFEQHDMIHL